jgi:hypothetical protein
MASHAVVTGLSSLTSFLGGLTVNQVIAVTTVIVGPFTYAVRSQSDFSSSSSDGRAKASIVSTFTRLATSRGPRFLLSPEFAREVSALFERQASVLDLYLISY